MLNINCLPGATQQQYYVDLSKTKLMKRPQKLGCLLGTGTGRGRGGGGGGSEGSTSRCLLF